MFEIVRQEWKTNRVKLTFLLPKYDTYEAALKKLKTLNETANVTFEIRKVEDTDGN